MVYITNKCMTPGGRYVRKQVAQNTANFSTVFNYERGKCLNQAQIYSTVRKI